MDLRKIAYNKNYICLDLQGGLNPQKNFITMHDTKLDNVDVVWDFNKLPYPFKDGSVDLLRADGIINKVPRENKHFLRFMDECWRILKYDGQFMISVPYAGSYAYYQDPCNCNPCNETTFCYFDPLEELAGRELYKLYKPKPWKIAHMTFNIGGIMEVLLEKRRIDTSYGKA